MSADPTHRSGPLLPIRTALILLLSVLTAIGVIVLLLVDRHSAAEAMLAGLGALAGAVKFFHWLIG